MRCVAVLASTMQWLGSMTTSGPNLQRGRGSLVALWATQVVHAAMFLMAGGSKLAGVPAMVSLFDLIGIGQWFRYVTGVIEVISGSPCRFLRPPFSKRCC
jgi:DoxX-like family